MWIVGKWIDSNDVNDDDSVAVAIINKWSMIGGQWLNAINLQTVKLWNWRSIRVGPNWLKRKSNWWRPYKSMEQFSGRGTSKRRVACGHWSMDDSWAVALRRPFCFMAAISNCWPLNWLAEVSLLFDGCVLLKCSRPLPLLVRFLAAVALVASLHWPLPAFGSGSLCCYCCCCCWWWWCCCCCHCSCCWLFDSTALRWGGRRRLTVSWRPWSKCRRWPSPGHCHVISCSFCFFLGALGSLAGRCCSLPLRVRGHQPPFALYSSAKASRVDCTATAPVAVWAPISAAH